MNKLVRQEMELPIAKRWIWLESIGKPQKDDDVRKQIEKLVNQQFEIRQERRQLEIKRMEAELRRVSEAIARRNTARKQIVEKRVTELLGQEEDVGF